MHCSSCVQKIEVTLQKNPEIEKVPSFSLSFLFLLTFSLFLFLSLSFSLQASVNLLSETGEIDHHSSISSETIRKMIQDLGFEVQIRFLFSS